VVVFSDLIPAFSGVLRAGMLALVLAGAVPALQADEQILISGGPALRYFERGKASSHDMYWGNFIDGALARMKELKPLPAGDTLTWLVYRPPYQRRGKEMDTDLLAEIIKKGHDQGAEILWFDTAEEMINYLNVGQDRSVVKVSRFEYFGHSNKRTWMFDYSNTIDGTGIEPDMFRTLNFTEIKMNVFAPTAYCRSWGCHSGEEFSQSWKKRFGIPMVGAIGKTDFSHGGLPFISTPGGKWTE
jgi:hypothetical protein